MAPIDEDTQKIGIKLQGTETPIPIEQVMAYFLKKLHSFFMKEGVESKNMVLTVPSYFTNNEC